MAEEDGDIYTFEDEEIAATRHVFSEEKKHEYTYYILKLENGKYYIGRTKRTMAERYPEHVAGKGSSWTSLHKPIEIITTIEGSKWQEDILFFEYVEKYGVDNVRGGTYTKITLSSSELSEIERKLDSVNNRCYKCHKAGHFAGKCGPSGGIICTRCGRNNHTIDKCIARHSIGGGKVVMCTRCGAGGHLRQTCVSKTLISGKPIEENKSSA